MARSALRASFVLILTVCTSLAVLRAQPPAVSAPASLTCAEMETFLRTAKIIGRGRDLPVGVTVPSRVTLDNGTWQHSAAVQNVDVKKATFEGRMGTEVNFRDSWQFNVAGYELAKLLRLNMVPPYVERAVFSYSSSLSWWVDDAMMERDRFRKKIQPPDVERWNHQVYAARVFHELIGDSDPNMTNMLITPDWQLWLIDFTRAFRLTRTLRRPEGLVGVDRMLLERMRELTEDRLRQALGRWVDRSEIRAVIARRDHLVELFEAQIEERGESVVLYDFTRTREPCGHGLSARAVAR
jgi:hypothetical protein